MERQKRSPQSLETGLQNDQGSFGVKHSKRFKGVQQHVNNNSKMHPRSKHFNQYVDFSELADKYEFLQPHVFRNKLGNPALDFKNPKALYYLSKAYLKEFYNVEWELPIEKCSYLIPSIPNRVNYVHHIADLLRPIDSFSHIPLNSNAEMDSVCESAQQHKSNNSLGMLRKRVLDVGTGANCIYPLLGVAEYGWYYTASDIDKEALEVAANNVKLNNYEENIKLIYQPEKSCFTNIVRCGDSHDFYVLSMCNPPFHQDVSQSNVCPVRTLEATSNEIVFESGDIGFITAMIEESKAYYMNVMWFTTLVPRLTTAKLLKKQLAQEIMSKGSQQQAMEVTSFIRKVAAATTMLEEQEARKLVSSFEMREAAKAIDSNTSNDDSMLAASPPLVRESRLLTLYQGKQTRWVLCWTYYEKFQRDYVLQLMGNSTQT